MEEQKDLETFLQDVTTSNVKNEFISLLKTVIREEVNSVLKDSYECRLRDLKDADVNEINHAVGMVKDISGKNSFSEGIETMRQDHLWLKKGRERSDKMSTAFFIVIVTTLTGGMLTSMWYGIKKIVVGV